MAPQSLPKLAETAAVIELVPNSKQESHKWLWRHSTRRRIASFPILKLRGPALPVRAISAIRRL